MFVSKHTQRLFYFMRHFSFPFSHKLTTDDRHGEVRNNVGQFELANEDQNQSQKRRPARE